MAKPYVRMIDSITGKTYIPVDHMLDSVRRNHRPDITEVELIRRMAQIGVHRKYIEATDPETHETIGVWLFDCGPPTAPAVPADEPPETYPQ